MDEHAVQNGRTLDDGAVRRDIALQNRDAAGFGIRFFAVRITVRFFTDAPATASFIVPPVTVKSDPSNSRCP
jgi:hypothetical protein